MKKVLIRIVFLVTILTGTHQHGSLVEPPSRNSAWTVDEDFKQCCTDYNYNELNCGGTNRLWYVNGGECGVCGDPYDGPRLFEKGGDKYLGKITRTYTQGSDIDVEILLTANHKGAFEFRICSLDNLEGDVTQECLNKTVLKIKDSDETKYIIDSEMTQKYTIQLPENLTCEHCVLQWKWLAAKDWGIDHKGKGCMGCGIFQEISYNCADISIEKAWNLKKIKSVELTSEKMITEDFSTTEETKKNTVEEIKSEATFEDTTKKTTASIQTSKKPKTRDRYSAIYNTCQTKLKFGTSLNFVNLMDIYCENLCSQKCPEILINLEKNLIKGISTPPHPDLISCLDTCPIVCDCN